ncbi:hypothetical protein BCEP4_30030 [Burkholderia cepacia]|nr:hypothetical protein BCEP4_30030 [Burkholderia cepacia]
MDASVAPRRYHVNTGDRRLLHQKLRIIPPEGTPWFPVNGTGKLDFQSNFSRLHEHVTRGSTCHRYANDAGVPAP